MREGEYFHRLPQILPDGEWLLFTLQKRAWDWEDTQIVAQSLETNKRRVLIENGADARYVPTRHLVFARLGALLTVPFDPKRLEIPGDPIGVAECVTQSVHAYSAVTDTGAAQFSFSASGSLAYEPGGIFPDVEDQLVWVDREGVAEPLPAPLDAYYVPRLSPDGNRLVVPIDRFPESPIGARGRLLYLRPMFLYAPGQRPE